MKGWQQVARNIGPTVNVGCIKGICQHSWLFLYIKTLCHLAKFRSITAWNSWAIRGIFWYNNLQDFKNNPFISHHLYSPSALKSWGDARACVNTPAHWCAGIKSTRAAGWRCVSVDECAMDDVSYHEQWCLYACQTRKGWRRTLIMSNSPLPHTAALYGVRE